MIRRTFFVLAALSLAAGVEAEASPVPPCAPIGLAQSPAYSAPGTPPAVQIWHDTAIEFREPCLNAMQGRMKLVIALAGRFEHATSLEELATRVGAISATKGLLYWSTTEERWRTLISEAFALSSPESKTPRADFSAQEVLSGETLYFAQEDTRSTGLNVYSLTARTTTKDRLVFEIVNLTKVRFVFLTLFEPRALVSVHFIDRLEANVWGYYGLAGVRRGAVDGNEKSFINRANALYRFFIKAPADGAPPLAR